MSSKIKGSGDGGVAVSESGTHAAFTGTHTHSHKAMGSQGGDEQHEHEHTHAGDAKHEHEHETKARSRAKARDFDTIFAQERPASDLLEDFDDLSDALQDALTELLLDNGGTGPDASEAPTLDTVLAQFEAAARAWFARAQMSDSWDDIADMAERDAQFTTDLMTDPPTYWDWCASRRAASRAAKHGLVGATPRAMPSAPARLGRKEGRAISATNRDTITNALDGMSDAMSEMQLHHKAIADLMEQTDPDRVRQDEDNTQGDDDTENGGTNPQKNNTPTTTRRTAAERPSQAGTTQSVIAASDPDWSAIMTDLDSVKTRLAARSAAHAGGKAT